MKGERRFTRFEQLSGRTVALTTGSAAGESISLINQKLALRKLPPVKVEWVDPSLAVEDVLEMVQVEVDTVVVRAHQGSAFEAEQIVVEGEGLTVADQFLLVFDAVVTAAYQALAVFVPAVFFSVLPAALDSGGSLTDTLSYRLNINRLRSNGFIDRSRFAGSGRRNRRPG